MFYTFIYGDISFLFFFSCFIYMKCRNNILKKIAKVIQRENKKQYDFACSFKAISEFPETGALALLWEQTELVSFLCHRSIGWSLIWWTKDTSFDKIGIQEADIQGISTRVKGGRHHAFSWELGYSTDLPQAPEPVDWSYVQSRQGVLVMGEDIPNLIIRQMVEKLYQDDCGEYAGYSENKWGSLAQNAARIADINDSHRAYVTLSSRNN